MARHQYVILSQAVDGQAAAFEHWYDHQHLDDVCKVDGVVGATRYRIDSQQAASDVPRWSSLAIYEIESDDPQAVKDAISAVAGTPAMPLSEAMSPTGMVQIIAHQVASAG